MTAATPMRVRVFAAGALLALCSASSAVHAWPWQWSSAEPVPEERAGSEVPWSYQGETGPGHWAELSPQFTECKGQRQSPVDLHGGRPLNYSPLTFRYRSSPLTVVNDGRSLRVGYPPGSFLIAGGREYELTGFHFHIPGEHRINGMAADMEIQFEHRDREGRMAVVAVPMVAGRRMNSTLSRIWDHLPPKGGESYYGRQVGINPIFLLPTVRDYYSYVGSLTEPPCTEGVEWFVLTTPVEVDASYLQRMARLVPGNVRPVQPLNGRPVLAVFRGR
jgi:carbonic anhydrase